MIRSIREILGKLLIEIKGTIDIKYEMSDEMIEQAPNKRGNMKSILILALIMASMNCLAMTQDCAENGGNCDNGRGPSSPNNAGASEQVNSNPQEDIVEQAYHGLPLENTIMGITNRSANENINKSAINFTASIKTYNSTTANERLDHLDSMLNAVIGNLSIEKKLMPLENKYQR